MNFPYSNPSPYIQAAMAQAVQAMMSGGPLPPNCVVMSIPYQPGQPIYPQLIMGATGANALDGSMFPPTNPFFPPTNVTSPFPTNPQTRALVPFANNGQQVPTNYNYPIVSNNKSKKKSKKTNRHQPHSNIYNSSSFDTYMKDLSWSRLFDHHSGKTSNQQQQQQQKKRLKTQYRSELKMKNRTHRNSNVQIRQVRRILQRQVTKQFDESMSQVNKQII